MCIQGANTRLLDGLERQLACKSRPIQYMEVLARYYLDFQGLYLIHTLSFRALLSFQLVISGASGSPYQQETT